MSKKRKKVSQLRRMGIPLVKLELDAKKIQALEQMQIYTVQALYGRIVKVNDDGELGFSGEELARLWVKVVDVLGPKELARLEKLAAVDFPICRDNDKESVASTSSDPRPLHVNRFFNRYW